MAFTQVSFIFLFFPFSTLLYLAVDKLCHNTRVSNTFLVVIGLYFYWWTNPKSIEFFATLILFAYYMGVKIRRTESDKIRKRLFIFSLIVCALLFFVYKYLPLFPKGAPTEAAREPLFSEVIIPVSLSFFILGVVSYLTDIYKREVKSGGILSAFTYMTVYPKLLCGPVITWSEMKPQIASRSITADRIEEGISRIIIGLAKKVIIADTLSAQIALINSKVAVVGADVPTMWVRALLIFFVIYCDFSGYSDIAIGLFKIMGFSIGENFDYPYLSTSLADFWRRWHRSLSNWMKKYIYIPLGGNKKGNIYFNIFITFFIAGAWHGGRPCILIWGAVNGLLAIAERAVRSKDWYQKIPAWLRWIMTMLLVLMGWVLFMAPDLQTAGLYYKGMFTPLAQGAVNFEWTFYMTRRVTIFLIIAAIGAFGGFKKLKELAQNKMSESAYYIITRILLLLLFALDIMFVVSARYVPFIYSAI